MTRVLFAFPQNAFLREYEHGYVPFLANELRQYGSEAGLSLANDAVAADLIILLQSAEYKTVEYLKILENDPLLRRHAERVFVIDYDDHPEGMLPGLYTSIEAPFFAPLLHHSWPILLMNNHSVYELSTEQIFKTTPRRLFSFIGAPSHQLRDRLFRLFGQASAEWHVQLSHKWYNHTEDDRARFVSIALDSLFCLCPRGYASYTNRIPEVMAMGRVPVIIADDWVPFSFPEDWPYYVRVPEKQVEELPQLLLALQDKAEELRHNARALWERHCSMGRRTVAAVESIRRLASNRTHPLTFSEYRERWRSREFLRRCEWTFTQRMALRARQKLRRLKLPGTSHQTRF
jgi:hypothetical protein